MATVINKLDKVDAWWWHRSNTTRWFLGALGAAAFMGVAGGVLS